MRYLLLFVVIITFNVCYSQTYHYEIKLDLDIANFDNFNEMKNDKIYYLSNLYDVRLNFDSEYKNGHYKSVDIWNSFVFSPKYKTVAYTINSQEFLQFDYRIENDSTLILSNMKCHCSDQSESTFSTKEKNSDVIKITKTYEGFIFISTISDDLEDNLNIYLMNNFVNLTFFELINVNNTEGGSTELPYYYAPIEN